MRILEAVEVESKGEGRMMVISCTLQRISDLAEEFSFHFLLDARSVPSRQVGKKADRRERRGALAVPTF